MTTARSFVRFPLFACALSAAASLVPAASAQENPPAVDGAGRYEATIRRTSYGIPHIVATDLASLGFGEGYAQAEDHLCTIADQVVRGRGERAKYFGRGEDDRHLLSDIAAKALGARADADSNRAVEPQEARDWFDGFRRRLQPVPRADGQRYGAGLVSWSGLGLPHHAGGPGGGEPSDAVRGLDRTRLRGSPDGMLIFAGKASHCIHCDDPDLVCGRSAVCLQLLPIAR
jgi:hypothetical protein